jgi:hypothetical protein
LILIKETYSYFYNKDTKSSQITIDKEEREKIRALKGELYKEAEITKYKSKK